MTSYLGHAGRAGSKPWFPPPYGSVTWAAGQRSNVFNYLKQFEQDKNVNPVPATRSLASLTRRAVPLRLWRTQSWKKQPEDGTHASTPTPWPALENFSFCFVFLGLRDMKFSEWLCVQTNGEIWIFFFKFFNIMVSLISRQSLLCYHLLFPIAWQIKMVYFEKSGKIFVMLLQGEMKTVWLIEVDNWGLAPLNWKFRKRWFGGFRSPGPWLFVMEYFGSLYKWTICFEPCFSFLLKLAKSLLPIMLT